MSLLERLGRKPIVKDEIEKLDVNDQIAQTEFQLKDQSSELYKSKEEILDYTQSENEIESEASLVSDQNADLTSKLELISKLDSDVNLTKALELLSSLSSQLSKNKKSDSILHELRDIESKEKVEKEHIEPPSFNSNHINEFAVDKPKESGGRVVSILSKSLDIKSDEISNVELDSKRAKKQSDKIEKNVEKENDLSVNLQNIESFGPNKEANEKILANSKLGLGSRLGLNTDVNSIPNPVPLQKLNANNNLRSTFAANQDQYQNLKLEIHRQIIEELSVEQQKIITNSSSDRTELERIVADLCNKVIDGENPFSIPRADRANIVNDIIDEVLGLGPIEPLLKDDTVSEVMINGPKMIYVERKGKLMLTNVQFQDEAHLMNIIERIVAPLGRRIDESSPLVDARLADGSRVNIIIPPLALNGACVTIRKFAKDPLTINNLIGFGTLDDDMASLIKACVTGRLNIVVSGGTGSGKTTTLNVLSSFIPEDERIVTIEDAAELQLRQDHVVTLESRPANVEGNGQVAIRDLVRNALRMRPDRIVVGEVRSGEALDMLQAMNTGHDGSLTTAHANSPRDVLSRLETMVLMAGMELPVKAIREQIASAIDLIIQQSRLRDGSRKITYITEVQGMEGDVIVLQDLFCFEQDGLDDNGKLKGSFKTTGIRPKFLEKLETNGIKLDCSMFIGDARWDE